MALNIDIYNASYFLSLDADYGVQEGSALGMPQERAIFAEPWQRRYYPLVGVNYGNREVRLEIQLSGTTLDDWIVNSNQLQQLLRDAELYQTTDGAEGDRAYIAIQLNGMTNTTEWEILRGRLDNSAFLRAMMTNTTAPRLLHVPLELTVKPFGGPQQYTRVTSGTLNNGGGATATNDRYVLAAPAGEIDAPAQIKFKPAAGAGAWRRAIIAGRARGNVNNFIFALNAEDGSYTGYTAVKGSSALPATGIACSTNVAVPAAHNGNVLRWKHSTGGGVPANGFTMVTWTLNKNLADFYGAYDAFLRIDTGFAVCTGLQLSYGGASGDDIALSKVAATFTNNDALVAMGRVEIPQERPPGNRTIGSFKMRLSGWFSSGVSGQMDLDCLYLMPADGVRVDLELAALSATQDGLVTNNLGPSPSLSVVDSSGDLKFSLRTAVNADVTPTLRPRHDSVWMALVTGSCSTGAILPGHELADQYTLAFDYLPQYELFR